ncbi:CorA family divalent cation transporter [Paenochrobactrum glaciei]|uniref:CorA family divalent cation transporter n=1 Tax=Paenochrobactrum glaciei TaxID=486407 RepID=A0ABP3REY8_9HYPH
MKKQTANSAVLFEGVKSIHNGRWLRVSSDKKDVLDFILKKTGADFRHAADKTATAQNKFSFLPVTFIDTSASDGTSVAAFNAVRVTFAISDDVVVSLEPQQVPAAMELALQRMNSDGRDSEDPFEIVVDIFQAIADRTDYIIGQLNDMTEQVMIETNAILKSLEVKSRDFGVTDIASTQLDLGDMEELLSHCMESQMALVGAVRHMRARISAERSDIRVLYDTLIQDIEAIEEHVEFVHDRVRFLQQINNMALNVKQNQIVKVFSVVTAVFLPSMMVTTYYSMNFEYMPILEWQYGEPLVMILTFLFALMPLFYIKHRGWLR